MALNFKLRRDAHSISEFNAVLVFSNSVSMHAFARVIEQLKTAAADLDLPAQMNVQVVNFTLPNGQMPPPPPGLGFQRFARDGEIACSLWCDADGIRLTIRDYDRWHNVFPKLLQAFLTIAPAYMSEVPAIKVCQVQYLNEFASNETAEISASEIFRSGSPWMAPFSANIAQPWHCHVGQFMPADDRSRYLLNVNFDVAPQPYPPTPVTRNFVKLLILVSRQYDLPGKGPLVLAVDELRAALEENFNSAHSLEKRLLSEIISDDYLDVMGEGARDH